MHKKLNLKNLNIDKSWSLFLDRDGVINVRLVDDYVKNIEEFRFLSGVVEAISKFSQVFGRVFIITNQQGIAKNLMTEQDLNIIHNHMLEQIRQAGGKIDAIYFCPHFKDEGCDCRKPKIGSALKAQQDFPEVDFNRSIMVGDTSTDMKFGENAGMHNILLSSDENDEYFTVKSLKELADML